MSLLVESLHMHGGTGIDIVYICYSTGEWFNTPLSNFITSTYGQCVLALESLVQYQVTFCNERSHNEYYIIE